MRKDEMLLAVNKYYKNDPWVEVIFGAAGAELDLIDEKILEFKNNQDILKTDLEGIEIYEKEAAIKPGATQTLSDRQASVLAKWRSGGKVDEELLQAVADAWENGRVEIDFVNSKIQVTFVSEYGLPSDRTGLEIALDNVKPAHLPIYYLIKYLLIRDVSAMTVAEIQTHEINEFAFRERS